MQLPIELIGSNVVYKVKVMFLLQSKEFSNLYYTTKNKSELTRSVKRAKKFDNYKAIDDHFEKIKNDYTKVWGSAYLFDWRDYYFAILADPLPTDVVLGGNQLQPKNTDAVLSRPFNYDQELAKLKDLSKEEFMKLIREVQTVKGFSSYYIVKWEVMQQYLTVSEWEAATKVTMDLEDEFQFNSWLKLISVDECFNEAGNFLFS